jgi:hypothetical protein
MLAHPINKGARQHSYIHILGRFRQCWQRMLATEAPKGFNQQAQPENGTAS